MWFKTPEIAWNGTDPVLSIDFGPGNRLATAGVDKTVNVRCQSQLCEPPASSFMFLPPLTQCSS